MSDLILQAFNYEGHEVRTVVMDDGTPAVVLSDIAKLLGYRDAPTAARMLRDHHKGYAKVCTPGGTQEMLVVTERGFNRLVIRSNAKDAEKIQDWLTDQVMPQIARTGSYGKPSLDLTSLDSISALLDAGKAALNRAIEAESRVQELAPKAAFADAVATSHTSILVGDLAKILKGNGLDIGANRLFARLREEGYLIRRNGTDWNMPTQKSMELGLFEVKETVVKHADGHSTISKTPKVTGKGQTYFIQRYLSRDLSESEAC